MTMVWKLERVPEPEVMDESSEVEAYASAAAQAYLEKIDRTFVTHVARLFPSGDPRLLCGLALDVGCGPGQIPIMMAARWPGLRITGLDAAPAMIEQARKDAARAGVAISAESPASPTPAQPDHARPAAPIWKPAAVTTPSRARQPP